MEKVTNKENYTMLRRQKACFDAFVFVVKHVMVFMLKFLCKIETH